MPDIFQLVAFVAGLASLYTTFKLNLDIGIKTWIEIKLLDRDIESVYDKGSKKDVKYLQTLLQIKKLYSTNSTIQGTAISQLYQLASSDKPELNANNIFNTLVERLGSRPKLDNANKVLLKSKIEELCKKSKRIHAESS